MTMARSPGSNAGYSLIELLVALGVTSVIMGTTMVSLRDAVRANDSVMHITGMNNMLRVSMDLLVRDLLQVGTGLPPGHVVSIPSGAQSQPIRLPGPPGTAFTSASGDLELAAVVPGDGRGPVVNGVATDTLTVLMGDNRLNAVSISKVSTTDVDVTTPADLDAAGGVEEGELIVVTKGSCSTLVQVTDLLPNGKIKFDSADSLNLNQPQAKEGSLSALKDCPGVASISRIRMVSYYIDATTDWRRPRLVRRLNNGDASVYDNTKFGTAVGLDIENLQFSYDLADGNDIVANVLFTAGDIGGSGACAPEPCGATQVRKINLALTARSKNGGLGSGQVYRNTLTSQISLRGMAFVNEYASE
jgi:Tfp pilus assembly protein PilW